jgi:septal ring factor EnvC (AmiA/AmiB activator)
MNTWMLIVPMLAFALLALALGLAAHRNHLAMEAMASRKQKIIDTVTKERYEAQKQCRIAQEQREKLNRENDVLHKHLEIMSKALKEAQATVKLRDGEKADLWFKIAQLEDEESARRAAEVNATIPLVEAVKPNESWHLPDPTLPPVEFTGKEEIMKKPEPKRTRKKAEASE